MLKPLRHVLVLVYIPALAPVTSRLQTAKSEIVAAIDATNLGILTDPILFGIYDQNREAWGLPQRLGTQRFVQFLEKTGLLKKLILQAEDRPGKKHTRYTWRDATDFELALSLKPGAYLSHGTAVHLLKLTDSIPTTAFVNKEQSPKPPPTHLTQHGIDNAFSRSHRVSNFAFQLPTMRAVLLSGKNTREAGVEEVALPNGREVRVAGVERTLIDIVVRPAYAGGIRNVVNAYRGAKGRVSIERLRTLLTEINHLYPYHQSIGFLMEFAEYPRSTYERFLETRPEFDLYLDHGLEDPHYDPKWRLYFPRNLRR